jgi:hypothetical protein
MSHPIRISVDDRALLAALGRQPRVVSRELRVEAKNQMNEVARVARKKGMHRFTTRTSNLERSTVPWVDNLGLQFGVEIDTGRAKYGRRIHDGGGGLKDKLGRRMTNKPDRYVEKAMLESRRYVPSAIAKAVRMAIRKSGVRVH